MSAGRRGDVTRERKWLVGVCLAACLAAAGAGWDNSATNDEPYNTFGAFAAAGGQGLFVVDHPPLVKLAAGLPLRALPIGPRELDPRQALRELAGTLHAFLHENSLPALAILRFARLGVLVFLPLFLWGVFRLGEVLAAPRVGLAAAAALACQPLLLGHAFVVQDDVPVAACWVWAWVFLERLVAGERRAFWGLFLWVGLALAAKLSAVLLVLFVALRLLVARLGGSPVALGPGLGALAFSGVVPLVLTAWTLRHASVEEERVLVAALAEKLSGWPWVGEIFPPLAALCQACAHYLLGLTLVLWNNAHGQGINFFWGQCSPYGFPLYFPVALLAKLSTPFTLLWVAALFSWRRLDPRLRWLGTFAGLYLLASLGSAFNIGARHLMPVTGWLAVLAGWVLARTGSRVRLVACAALVAAPVWAFPHYISHFSLVVGGTRGGAKILHDSNLDWGQDWARLAKAAESGKWQPLFAVYLGTDDPSGYGVPVENLLATGRFPPSGYVAVSSWAATVGPEYLSYRGYPENAKFLRDVLRLLANCSTVGEVGHTITVYRCERAPAPGPPLPAPTPRP